MHIRNFHPTSKYWFCFVNRKFPVKMSSKIPVSVNYPCSAANLMISYLHRIGQTGKIADLSRQGYRVSLYWKTTNLVLVLNPSSTYCDVFSTFLALCDDKPFLFYSWVAVKKVSYVLIHEVSSTNTAMNTCCQVHWEELYCNITKEITN